MNKSRVLSLSMFLLLSGAMNMTFAAPEGRSLDDVQGYDVVQQTGRCSGVVKDASGETVIGASVLVKGTSTGTITDFDGNFTLEGVNRGAVLVISYVGYQTQEVVWNGTALNVVLKDDAALLDEVVVTAYGGKTLRSKLTNSIAKVDNEALTAGMHTNAAASLSGAVAGLRVTQTSGDPTAAPSITLRGGTSLNGTGSPLIIVDGVVRSNMNDINAADIESMEVMKDAGATAIYGARAANGVILITTKRGKEGHTQIGVSAKVGLNYFNNNYTFLGAEDYLYWMRTAYNRSANYWTDSNGGAHGSTTTASLSGVQPYGTGNIYFNADGSIADGNKVNAANWSTMFYDDSLSFLLKEGWKTMTDPVTGKQLIFKEFNMEDVNIQSPALTQDYTIDFTGGNDKGSYYSSLGFNNSEGSAVGNWYKRFTWTFNADYKLRKWLTSRSSFNYAHNTWYGIVGDNDPANYFSRVFSVPPTFRGTNAEGEWLVGVRGNSDGNVEIWKDALYRDNNTDKFSMNQVFEFHLMKGLDLKLSGTWYYVDTKNEKFNRDYLTGVNRYYTTRYSYDSYDRGLTQTYNAVLTYNTTINRDHSISAMAGSEYYAFESKGFDADGYGAASDDFQDLSLTQTEGRNIDSWHNQNRIMSYFGKVDYDYQGKYLFSAVLRRDGYSRLTNNRWGMFPGFSAGWVITKENFMQKYANVVSFAKLRASYGANGNLDTSRIGNYTVQGAYGMQTNYGQNTAILLTTLPNHGLRWEKSYTAEVGVDLGFLENRINTAITYYNRHTKDKLADITYPSHSGTSTFLSNNGEIENQGIEFELNAKILNSKNLKWNAGFNISYNKNKIISLPDNGLERNRQSAFQVYTGKGDEKAWVGGYQEGQTPGDLYGFQALGIYKSYDEIPGNLKDVTSGNNGSNGKPLYGPQAWAQLSDSQKNAGFPIQPGDVKWKDVNGDGVIDNYDQVKLGNTVPKFTGGLNTSLTWKDLTLSIRMDYALGYKVVDNRTPWIMGNMQGTYNTVDLVKQTWSEDNPNGKYPIYAWADQLGKRNYARSNTSMFVYSGDYLAFRDISLTYNLPKALISKIKLEKAAFTVTGQNLGYITAAKNMASPEYGANSMGGYALPRTVIFGLNIGF